MWVTQGAGFSQGGLEQCLHLAPIGEDRFSAPSLALSYPRMFGGQLLAQSVVAAATGEPDRSVKSIRIDFLREGAHDRPVEIRVHRVHASRTFATITIDVTQDGRGLSVALVSMHAPEVGLEAQRPAPDAGRPADADPRTHAFVPFETRTVGADDLDARAAGPPSYAFWLRGEPPDAGPARHLALLSAATLSTGVGTALRPIDGLSHLDAPARLITSLTGHTIWFHRDLRIDDWLLVEQDSPVLTGGRGFTRGDVFTESGSLVASFVSESLVRPR
jgi:acyl-CoA thioesterase II